MVGTLRPGLLAGCATRQMILLSFANPFVKVYYIRVHVRIGGRARKTETGAEARGNAYGQAAARPGRRRNGQEGNAGGAGGLAAHPGRAREQDPAADVPPPRGR